MKLRACRLGAVALTAVFVFFPLLCCSRLRAAAGATISGRVLDPAGAAVPAATLVLRNVQDGRQWKCSTAGDGSFRFSLLAAGRYQLRIDAPGFKPYVRSGIALNGESAIVIDAELSLAPVTARVEVSLENEQVNLTSPQLGETVASKSMATLPLNGRSFTDLLAVQSGIVPVSSKQPDAVVMSGAAAFPPSGDLNPGNLSVNGQREAANGFEVNGSDVEEDFNMGTAIVPDLASIQEFRVLSGNYDARYGNYGGGQVIVVTKSGTHHWHGTAFEFLRNTDLDARNYFSPERARFQRHQFGGTLGGPIEKNKVYFFVDYQGTRMAQGVATGIIRVPSRAARSGDLSDLATSLTGTVHGQYWANLLSQKLGYSVEPDERYYSPGCTSSSQCVLPNAQIPENAWSNPAVHLLSYIPEPNQGGNTFSTSAYDETVHDNKGSAKLDGDTRWGRLSAYYFVDDYFLNNPYPTEQGGANVPGFSAVSQGRAQLFSFDATKTLGAKAVNDFHVSYMRFANDVGQPLGGVGPSLASQGFVEGQGTLGIVPLAPRIEGIENVVFNDFTFGVDVTGETQVNNTYQFADNLTRIVGSHTLQMGADVHFDQININPDAVFNGSFQFEGTETGSDFADFLLGVASFYRQGDSHSFYPRDKYIGLYGQDTWRLRRNLTLDYGLRWDVLPPWYEKYNQQQTLVLGQQSVVYPGAPRGLVFPGDPGVPRTLAPTQYTNFAPRLGIAFSPDFRSGLLAKLFGAAGKTSIRTGYGIFYTAFPGLSAGIMSANPPYGYDYDSSTIGPPLFATPFVAAATGKSLGQPFPSPIPAYGASAAHPNTAVNWAKYEPITGDPAFYPRNVSPYAENYTFSLQRQLASTTLLTVSYVGGQAHHLLVILSANPGDPGVCLRTPGCGPFSETGEREPFGSQFDADSYQETIANSNYNALEVDLSRRAGALGFLIGYTYSKSIDQSSSLAEPVYPFATDASGNKIGPSLSRAISAFDMTHNFVASYRYELPIGMLIPHHKRLTSGWVISGITRFSTGFPVMLFNNNDTSLLGTIPNGINNNGIDTPNFTPGPLEINNNPRNGKPDFNTSLFSLPSLGEIGTAARRFFHGPGICNFDMAIEKDVSLPESKSLEFRLEAFNVFNHAQFYGPAAVEGNISSASFGRVVSAEAPRLIQLMARLIF